MIKDFVLIYSQKVYFQKTLAQSLDCPQSLPYCEVTKQSSTRDREPHEHPTEKLTNQPTHNSPKLNFELKKVLFLYKSSPRSLKKTNLVSGWARRNFCSIQSIHSPFTKQVSFLLQQKAFI